MHTVYIYMCVCLQVYVGVPTRFTASVGQGINMTFLWSFNEEGTVEYINDTINPQTCSTQCYQSEQVSYELRVCLQNIITQF